MAASPADSLRLFVGITVPPDLHAPLLAVRTLTDAPWRWTAPERLHVTLQFLGNQPREALAPMTAALTALERHAPVALTIGGWHGFPRHGAARVLTREIQPSDALQALHGTTFEALQPWLPAGPAAIFRPHVTLARSKTVLAVPETAVLPLDWTAGEAHLIESRLTPQGPDYRVLATFSLGAERWEGSKPG